MWPLWGSELLSLAETDVRCLHISYCLQNKFPKPNVGNVSGSGCHRLPLAWGRVLGLSIGSRACALFNLFPTIKSNLPHLIGLFGLFSIFSVSPKWWLSSQIASPSLPWRTWEFLLDIFAAFLHKIWCFRVGTWPHFVVLVCHHFQVHQQVLPRWVPYADSMAVPKPLSSPCTASQPPWECYLTCLSQHPLGFNSSQDLMLCWHPKPFLRFMELPSWLKAVNAEDCSSQGIIKDTWGQLIWSLPVPQTPGEI